MGKSGQDRISLLWPTQPPAMKRRNQICREYEAFLVSYHTNYNTGDRWVGGINSNFNQLL